MSTLSELETEVAEELGDINTTDDQTAIRRELNRGVRDFLRRTRCYVEEDTFTPGANNNWTLDATVLVLIDIYFTDSDSPLEQISVADIMRKRRASSASTSHPRFYAWRPPKVMFEYAPDANATVTVVNVPAPTAMSSSAHDPSNATYGGVPIDYHDAIALYAMWKFGSRGDDQSSAQGQRYKDWYLERVKDAKRELRLKGGLRLPRSVVGRRAFIPRDNSTDW